jgi:hypothetical protein
MNHGVRTRSGAWQAIAAVMLAGTFAACGGGPICLNCTPSGSPTPGFVTVTGNISSNDNPTLLVTVAICVDQKDVTNPSNCTNPSLVDVNQTTNTFTHTGVEPGPETIFFTQSSTPGVVSDFAQLSDPMRELDDVPAGSTVTLANVQVLFFAQPPSAQANITVATPTPTPIGTPTPVPTAT